MSGPRLRECEHDLLPEYEDCPKCEAERRARIAVDKQAEQALADLEAAVVAMLDALDDDVRRKNPMCVRTRMKHLAMRKALAAFRGQQTAKTKAD